MTNEPSEAESGSDPWANPGFNLNGFALLSLFLLPGALVDMFTDACARMTVVHQPFGEAIDKCILDRITSPVATAISMLPFIIVGIAAIVQLRDKRPLRMWVSLISAFVLLLLWNFKGYYGVRVAMARGAWTAAALSQGFTAIGGCLVALVGLAIGHALSGAIESRRRRANGGA
jgi:hypothetical protein